MATLYSIVEHHPPLARVSQKSCDTVTVGQKKELRQRTGEALIDVGGLRNLLQKYAHALWMVLGVSDTHALLNAVQEAVFSGRQVTEELPTICAV